MFSGSLRMECLEDRRVLASLVELSAGLASAEGESVDLAWQVPNNAGESATKFTWAARHADFNNEMGLFPVDDAAGTIDGLTPDDAGYPAAALASSQVVFASGETAGAVTELALEAGSYFGVYLIQNATTASWLQANQSGASPPNVFFSFATANRGDFEQLRPLANHRYGWEDLAFGGDQDYNDMIFEITFPQVEIESGNRAITTDSGVQQNPSVAVDPNDPDHVVIAYMDYSLVDTGYAGIGVSVSTDGGKSFTKTSIPVPEAFAQGAANPIAKFDDAGRVYVSYMAATFLAEQPHLTNGNFFDPELGRSPREFGTRANNGVFVRAVTTAD